MIAICGTTQLSMAEVPRKLSTLSRGANPTGKPTWNWFTKAAVTWALAVLFGVLTSSLNTAPTA